MNECDNNMRAEYMVAYSNVGDPANTEVEAREHASADDSYDEQQVSACCGENSSWGRDVRLLRE